MPFPLMLPAERALGALDPTETLACWCPPASGSPSHPHYAIKRPPNPSTQTFL